MRISIVGSSGSGKTTLAKRLSKTAGLPHLEIDSIYHQAEWQPLPTPAFRARVTAFMDTHDHWIVDGNYGVVRDLVWARADRVVWLDFSRVRVSWQMLKRTVQRLASRKELWNGNRETLRDHLSMDADRSLMLYAHQVFEKNRRFYAGAMSDDVWSHIEFFRIQNRRSLEDWLAEKPGNTRVE